MRQAANNKISTLLNHAGRKLLATTAITAVGLFSSTVSAKADNWVDLSTTAGSTTTDLSQTNTTNININSGRAVVEGDLDINAGWTVNVGAGDLVAIDRENDPTYIHGRLNCAGSCHVLDNNGVIVSDPGSIDAVGVATLSDGELQDISRFMETGEVVLGNFSGDGVENKGNLTAGAVGLISPKVNNKGQINARMGNVVLAAGETVTLDMYGDGLIEVAVEGEVADALLENSGTITANGGNVLISASVAKTVVNDVINMEGTTTVSSAQVKGGKIILSGGNGGVRVKGALNANGVGGQNAGSVKVTGKNIKVEQSGRIRANAQDAEAGNIEVIATETLTIDGQISAAGLTGTGFVETSAPDVDFGLNASILANREWLLDPTNIIIDNALGLLIEGQLASGSMTVQTPVAGADAGDIDVNTVIDWTTSNIFNLIAENDINFNNGGGISNVNSAGTFTADAGRDINMRVGNQGITMHGGDVLLTSAGAFTLDDNDIRSSGGNITIDNGGSFTALANSLVTNGTGTIEINQNKDASNPTIKNAIDSIFNLGDGVNTINVGAGTWSEDVKVNVHNLTLNGANVGVSGNDLARAPETIIDSSATAVLVAADNVFVDGFMIDGGNTQGTIGVEALNSENTTIQNNVINNTARNAVHFDNAKTINILDNNINRSGNAIAGENSGDITITDNTIDRTSADGIQIVDSSLINVINNTITATDGDGIEINRSADIDIDGNMIDLLGGNPALNSDGVELKDVENINVTDNEISNATQDGVSILRVSNGAVIADNMIDNSGVNGILVEESSDTIVVADNTLSSNVNGIQILNTDAANTGDVVVSDNVLNDNTDKSILIDNSDNVSVLTNEIDAGNTQGTIGVEVINSDNTEVSENTINNTARNAVHFDNATAIDIVDNEINQSGNAIAGENSSDIDIEDNTIDRTSADGIQIVDSSMIDITDNTITATDGDGVEINRSADINIADNMIDLLGGNPALNSDGIELKDVENINVTDNTVSNATQDGVSVLNASNGAVISDNTIENSGADGIEVADTDNILITDNTISNSGDNGIALLSGSPAGESTQTVVLIDPNTAMNSIITGNTVSESNNNGLLVGGTNHGDVVLSDNTFTNQATGARFESGAIDLTSDEPNTFTIDPDYDLPPEYDYVTGLQFELAEGAPANSLTIVDETLGETIFEGYDSIPAGNSYYVRFEDSAILDESGNVIVIDGTSASFDELVPSTFGNVLPAPTLQALESRLFDADDAPLNGRGQIFVGVSPLVVNIDQEDIFDTFDLADDGLGGLNVTILPFDNALPPTPTGLNNIAPAAGSTNPADLNNIETAAGGETDPASLNDIETAAGGDEKTCWDDVLNSTSSGQSSTFSHDGSAADLLKEEASCGS